MQPTSILTDEHDGSINHVYADGSEFRLVHRETHDTIYLSSHTGCSLGCKMCHLTTSGQTEMKLLPFYSMVDRALLLRCKSSAQFINFQFMSRGDAWLNSEVGADLVNQLLDACHYNDGHAQVGISTIFPGVKAGDGNALFETLVKRFGSYKPIIYWSLYSLENSFRKKWLPKAGDPSAVFVGLAEWQRRTGAQIVLHHALIENENDYGIEAHDICEKLYDYDLHVNVNLIRYNDATGEVKEASQETYQKHLAIYKEHPNVMRAQIKERVGFDVKASCGMFT